ncbi:hypothetical protein EYF80_037062 [Liparis tanakae]|uniref:Uncharacterized protein n=1 Tax=Liparis tanakae TaxID=230148 RepID=A0A4Z2GGU0_9TELE|nr:hypothetical protein EYF80_037062 [Liparis tanakae]
MVPSLGDSSIFTCSLHAGTGWIHVAPDGQSAPNSLHVKKRAADPSSQTSWWAPCPHGRPRSGFKLRGAPDPRRVRGSESDGGSLKGLWGLKTPPLMSTGTPKINSVFNFLTVALINA